MSEAIETNQADNLHLGMSDEDFLKAGPPAVVVEDVAPVEVETPVDVAPVVEVPVSNVDAEEDDEGEGADAVPGAAVGTEEAPKPEKADDAAADVKPEIEITPVTPADQATINYEAEYKKLLAPFKANGRDIQVNSVEDAKSLMQMGANYNKKMAGLKPSLKILKLLENNGLLDESKLSFLIDLDKRDPQAINKLVKDSGLNPMDLDADKASEYKPKLHSVDDREVELDTVLSDMEDTPTYARTLQVVSKEWDGPSKQVISSQPELLKVINSHMQSGIYDLISTEVEKERMFGRLNGLSNIEAYRQVGDAIEARGGFAHLGSSQDKPNTPPVVVVPKQKVDDGVLKDKRRAAGSAPVVANTAPAQDFNPLGMSDEEFAKAAAPRFK